MQRNKFLLELSMTLIKSFLTTRLLYYTLKFLTKCLIKTFLNDEDLFKEREGPCNLRLDTSNKLYKVALYCYFCLFSKGRTKIVRKCLKCNIPLCEQLMAKICQSCAEYQLFKY